MADFIFTGSVRKAASPGKAGCGITEAAVGKDMRGLRVVTMSPSQ